LLIAEPKQVPAHGPDPQENESPHTWNQDCLGLAAELMSSDPSITVVIFCWRICWISESMGHHDSEIMDDGSID
jgi:hypothetical protein